MVSTWLRTAAIAIAVDSAVALAPGCAGCRVAAQGHRASHVQMLEPPFKLPYHVPTLPKPYADYVWDDAYPGTLKPGTREEDWSTDDVFKLWENRDNPNSIQLSSDELWAIPLPPPEDILSWLDRIGLLDDDEDADEGGNLADSSLLDEEFDLEEGDADSDLGLGSMLETPKESGATMSDFL